MTTLLSRKKQDEKNLRVLRELVTLPYNRECFDCHQRGPTYVNMTIGSFICTTCSGILRGLNPPHRVKSITMASFSQDEIDMIKNKGNEVCQKIWLGLKVPSETLEPVNKNEAHLKDLLVMKYEKKQFYVDPNPSPDEKISSISQNSNAAISINPPLSKSLSHSFDVGLIEENFLNSGNDVLNFENQSQQNHVPSTLTVSPDAFKKNAHSTNVELLIDPFSEKNDNKLNKRSEQFANFENNPVFNKNNFQNTNKGNQHLQTSSPCSSFPFLNHLKSRWITFESESYESLPNVTPDIFLGFHFKNLSNQDTINNAFNFSINHYDDPIAVNENYQNTDLNSMSYKCPLCNNNSSQIKGHLHSSASINFPDTLHSIEVQSKVSNSSASSPDRYAALAALDNELKAHLNANVEESSPNNINWNFDVFSNSTVNNLNAFSNSFQVPSKSSKSSSPNCITNTSYNATRFSANPFSVCTAALVTSTVLHLSGISTPSVSNASTGNSVCPVPFKSGSSVQYSQFPSQLRPQIVSQHNWAASLQTGKVNPFLGYQFEN